MNEIKLQLFLSHNGVCSRRNALDIIKAGSVRVNGRKVTEPSVKIDPGRDIVSVGGKEISEKNYDYILFNKPKGFITTKKDKFADKTILDLLPRQYHHLSPVGRLDKDTEGLLLLTNDGDSAYKLTHPKFNIDKTYFVNILGRLEVKSKRLLENGIFIDKSRTSKAKIRIIRLKNKDTELLLTIHEGKKRQVRRMFSKVGHKVVYLKRLSQGPLSLGNLRLGKFRLLTKQEIELIRK
ncbi:MAG: pseudouridine synthase [Candidatus Zapsychrus exili]|nr:pseudouridine synthase [Candidatus Zapsychrus exili]